MKTIKEAAKESVSEVLTVKENESAWIETSDLHDYLADQFIAGVEFAQRWIPIEEETPELNTWIIIELKKATTKNKYVTMFLKTQFEIEFIKENVIKWRPIELK